MNDKTLVSRPNPADLGLQHFPDATDNFVSHPSQAKPGIHVYPDKLYVVTCLENPLRWRSRYANYYAFQKHVADSGAILVTVELAMGGRQFEVTQKDDPYDLQVRTRDELFHKENLQNLGAERLPHGVQYVAFIDADAIFTRQDWAQETMHLLQHYDVIQMFSNYVDLRPDHTTCSPVPSFMYNYYHDGDCFPDPYCHYKPRKWSGAPGLAWAYRIEALDKLGRLLDRCILGGGDSHMAFGLVGQKDLAKLHQEVKHSTDAYRKYIAEWQINASILNKNVGYMDGTLLHKWHGERGKRGYTTRWKILDDDQFDPYVDVKLDHQGVLVWTGNKPKLRDDVRHYFRSRSEDQC